MAYPFVASANDLGLAKGPRLAVVWHMAEGGGTVGYLAKPNPNGVSVHFVIEYTGRIVQMLAVTHMQSSIRTSDIRTTDDADGFYGRSHALAVMGTWADISHGTQGPNHASLAVEMEGFAATGPNALQTVAMGKLWADLSTRYPTIRSLAHRDFQDYKACPGRHIPWSVVGGHGEAEAMADSFVVAHDMTIHLVAGTKVYDDSAFTKPHSVIEAGGHTYPLVGTGPNWLVIFEDSKHRALYCTAPRPPAVVTTTPPAPADCSEWEAWYAQAPHS